MNLGKERYKWDSLQKKKIQVGTYDHAPHFALVAMSRLSIFEVQCCRILVGDGKKCLLFFSLFFLMFVFEIFKNLKLS